MPLHPGLPFGQERWNRLMHFMHTKPSGYMPLGFFILRSACQFDMILLPASAQTTPEDVVA